MLRCGKVHTAAVVYAQQPDTSITELKNGADSYEKNKEFSGFKRVRFKSTEWRP